MAELSGKKILVVDDEPNTRIFLANLLGSEGFHPLTAENKQEGIHQAMQQDPAVIILNMMMPGEGGIHMYRSLKRDEKLKGIPVIMLSTLDRQTFLKCHNLYAHQACKVYEGEDIFLQQPPEADEFLTLVRKLSHRRASADSD